VTKKKSERVFFVDTAKSVVVRGEKYWKCSVVENEKNIVNFLNSRAV
jgi:hypothetical protein